MEEFYQEKWENEQLKAALKEERIQTKDRENQIEKLKMKLTLDEDKTRKIEELEKIKILVSNYRLANTSLKK